MPPASKSMPATASDDANLAPTMPDRRITFTREPLRELARAPVGGRCEGRGRERRIEAAGASVRSLSDDTWASRVRARSKRHALRHRPTVRQSDRNAPTLKRTTPRVVARDAVTPAAATAYSSATSTTTAMTSPLSSRMRHCRRRYLHRRRHRACGASACAPGRERACVASSVAVADARSILMLLAFASAWDAPRTTPAWARSTGHKP